MMLCCLHDGFNGTVGLSLSQVFLESISEDGQLAIGLEATEGFLGLQQAGGGPSERHLGVSPAFDVAGDLATLAALHIVYLAYRIATAPPLVDAAQNQARPSFTGGVLLAFANPKGWAAMTALFSGFVLVAGNLTLNAALMVLILASIMVVTDVSWLLVGASLTRFFREPRLNRLINVSFAVLLVASVAVTLAFWSIASGTGGIRRWRQRGFLRRAGRNPR